MNHECSVIVNTPDGLGDSWQITCTCGHTVAPMVYLGDAVTMFGLHVARAEYAALSAIIEDGNDDVVSMDRSATSSARAILAGAMRRRNSGAATGPQPVPRHYVPRYYPG